MELGMSVFLGRITFVKSLSRRELDWVGRASRLRYRLPESLPAPWGAQGQGLAVGGGRSKWPCKVPLLEAVSLRAQLYWNRDAGGGVHSLCLLKYSKSHSTSVHRGLLYPFFILNNPSASTLHLVGF